MNINFSEGPETPQAPSQNPQSNGVEGLMSSLISPGPSTPGLNAYKPWLGLNEWPMFRSGFPSADQENPQQLNQDQFQYNFGAAYAPQGINGGQQEANDIFNGNGSVQMPTPPFMPTESASVQALNPPSKTADAAAENEKRLKDLRAKLIASKTKGSHESSPASKPKDLSNSSENVQSKAKVAHDPSLKIPPSHPDAGSAFLNRTGINSDLDNLFAEVRGEAKDLSNGANKSSDGQGAGDLPSKLDAPNPSNASKAISPASPELSEGEIRSDEETAVVPSESKALQKPQMSKEASLDSEEKSRRESEVEALYKKQSASRDSQEKLRRQSQVDLAYSPLRKPSAVSGKLDTSAVQRKLSSYKHGPKSAVDPPSRSWVTQPKARAAEYDSYVPAHSRLALDDTQGGRDLNIDQRTGAGDRVRLRDVYEPAGQASTASNSGGRPEPMRVISHTDTVYLGRVDPETQELSKESESTGDPDLQDWLELTEYHDENFRRTRLARFRKKRELDRLRQQLDEEETAELQQRSLLRNSGLGKEPTPQLTKMPPPALAIRDSKSDGAAALSDGQLATPTLKRQHAEVKTDARSKVPRVETHRGAGITLKEETSPTFADQGRPMEHRISRDDGQIGSRLRRRSRSPDRYRRRSASPDHRHHAISEQMHSRACHNCGEFGHYQSTCPKPRRDGRDRPRGPAARAKIDGVSANYLGKKPHAISKDMKGLTNGSARNIDDDDKRP